MSELVAAIENLKPDNFTPTIIDKQVSGYLLYTIRNTAFKAS